jgi:hypothetical protein
MEMITFLFPQRACSVYQISFFCPSVLLVSLIGILEIMARPAMLGLPELDFWPRTPVILSVLLYHTVG